MLLGKFADQVMAIFQQAPTPSEILVEGVDFMRNAEAENRLEPTLVNRGAIHQAVLHAVA